MPIHIDDQNGKSGHENPYWPFENEGQWDIVFGCLYPERLSNKRIKRIAINKYNRALHGDGFESLQDFKKRVKLLSSKGVAFRVYQFTRTKSAPEWAPLTIDVWMRNTLEVVKQLVGNRRWANELKWASEEVYNEKNERIFSELWTGNWWKRMQVRL